MDKQFRQNSKLTISPILTSSSIASPFQSLPDISNLRLISKYPTRFQNTTYQLPPPPPTTSPHTNNLQLRVDSTSSVGRLEGLMVVLEIEMATMTVVMGRGKGRCCRGTALVGGIWGARLNRLEFFAVILLAKGNICFFFFRQFYFAVLGMVGSFCNKRLAFSKKYPFARFFNAPPPSVSQKKSTQIYPPLNLHQSSTAKNSKSSPKLPTHATLSLFSTASEILPSPRQLHLKAIQVAFRPHRIPVQRPAVRLNKIRGKTILRSLLPQK